MSSNTTERLGLNQWVGSDKPKMNEFNNDNAIIDSILGEHIDDVSVHLTPTERNRWNNNIGIATYYGDGKTSKIVNLNFDFEPRICFVFATNATPSVIDILNNVDYNYFGIATNRGSMYGLNLDETTLVVQQSGALYANNEMRSYNELGKTYIVVAFR